MMPRLFLPDHALQPLDYRFIRCSAAQKRAQVVLRHAEQTRADLAIRRQAQAVAVAAEWLADGRNDADFALSVRKSPASCRGGGIFHGEPAEREARLQA